MRTNIATNASSNGFRSTVQLGFPSVRPRDRIWEEKPPSWTFRWGAAGWTRGSFSSRGCCYAYKFRRGKINCRLRWGLPSCVSFGLGRPGWSFWTSRRRTSSASVSSSRDFGSSTDAELQLPPIGAKPAVPASAAWNGGVVIRKRRGPTNADRVKRSSRTCPWAGAGWKPTRTWRKGWSCGCRPRPGKTNCRSWWTAPWSVRSGRASRGWSSSGLSRAQNIASASA